MGSREDTVTHAEVKAFVEEFSDLIVRAIDFGRRDPTAKDLAFAMSVVHLAASERDGGRCLRELRGVLSLFAGRKSSVFKLPKEAECDAP